MDIQEVIDKLKEALELAEGLKNQQILEQSAFRDPSKTIEEYLQHIERAQKEGNTKARRATINGIRIPDECFRHIEGEIPKGGHDLSKEDWVQFINNIQPEKDKQQKSNKAPKYDGVPYLYTTEITGKYYGYVLEEFPNKLPILVTAFYTDPNSLKAWLYNNSLRKPKSEKES